MGSQSRTRLSDEAQHTQESDKAANSEGLGAARATSEGDPERPPRV